MDPIQIALLALRASTTLFTLQGRPEISEAVNSMIRAWEAGRNIDAYMAEIARALESDAGLDDWKTITDKINREVDDFLSQD